MAREDGPNNEGGSGPKEQGFLVGGSTTQGSVFASTASQDGSSACAGRSEVALDSGASANIACFAWLRSHNGS